MNFNINLDDYFKWYANWKETSLDEIKNFEYKYSMISDFLDIISLKVDNSIIGKEVYYSINAEHQDELTYDVYIEGCIIKKGIIVDIPTGKPVGILFMQDLFLMLTMVCQATTTLLN